MAMSFMSSMQRVLPCQPGRVAPVCQVSPLERQIPSRPLSIIRVPGRGVAARASDDPKGSYTTDKIVSDLQEKWENVDDKTSVGIYAGGALLALWIASSVVGVFNSIPLLPKLFELVGLVYSGWFVYRYLLFKSSREELIRDIDTLKDKITGEE